MNEQHQANRARGLCRCGADPGDRFLTCYECRTRHRLWREAREERAASDGMCSSCWIRPRDPGRVRCSACRERTNAYLRDRRRDAVANGQCSSCVIGEPESGMRMCRDCQRTKDSKASRLSQKQMRARAKAAGRCTQCMVNPSAPDRTCCERCLERARVAARERYTRWSEQGLCVRCGGDRSDGARWCDVCSLKQKMGRIAREERNEQRQAA